MKTTILSTKGNWNEVMNVSRATVNKPPLKGEPSDKFVNKMLLAEHSPIRLISFLWQWKHLPHWVGVHWVRHKWECFVATQRTDRTGIDRTKLPQDQPQDFIGEANLQNLIDTMRKRLCNMASPETKLYAIDLRNAIKKEDPRIAKVLVPNCIYRCGCPEEHPCNFFNIFKEVFEGDITDIEERYEFYDKL